MFKKVFFAAIASVLCLTVSAQEKTPAAIPSKGNSETAELLAMAGQLVKYGYDTKTALPLIQAVEIYNRLGATSQDLSKTDEAGQSVKIADDTKTASMGHTQQQLLADATTFAEGDKNLLALIQDAGNTRGRVNGPLMHTDRVKAGYTDVYRYTFRGGEEALILVSGDGDTDLDLYVYDENDNLIDYDTDRTDTCAASFTPRWTGEFKIKIKNLGNVYNEYLLLIN